VTDGQGPVWGQPNLAAERVVAAVVAAIALVGVALVVLIGLVPGGMSVAGSTGLAWQTRIGVGSAVALVIALVLVFHAERQAPSQVRQGLARLALAAAVALGATTALVGGFALSWISAA
jgi:hypothetical protein